MDLNFTFTEYVSTSQFTTVKVEKKIKMYPGFDPITFTFSENSNYGQESLPEV